MANRPNADRFDDELLSAYLDDELSAEERAHVEARLASDPTARQVLDQLRAVLQAVQGLPQQSVGTDLSGAVLQRAERAMLTSATTPVSGRISHSDSTQPDSLPRFTIGRSRRGWMWAGLAVAAALVIMVTQPERGDNDSLPATASRRALEKPRGLARTNSEWRAAPQQPASSAIVAESPADRNALSTSAADGNEWLVVRVDVTPTALRSQAFDKLLASNGIVVADPTSDQKLRGLRKQTSAEQTGRQPSVEDESAAEPQPMDRVLVTAPANQIERFLENLSADEENYLGLAIDEAPIDNRAQQVAKERHWQQYNRNRVQQPGNAPRRREGDTAGGDAAARFTESETPRQARSHEAADTVKVLFVLNLPSASASAVGEQAR